MRKIEQQMCRAISNNQSWQSDNTGVITDVNGVSHVYLHGNKIAEVDDTSMTIFDGGYQSKTTKSRLNSLITEFCNGVTDGVFQKNYQWFIMDNNEVKKEFTNGYTFCLRTYDHIQSTYVEGDCRNCCDTYSHQRAKV